MLHRRGTGHGSIIMGRSVQNQWIERLEKSVFWLYKLFYHLFYQMEDRGILNPDIDTYILSTHHIPSRDTVTFKFFFSGWSNHHLQTAHNKMPLQMWIEGMTTLADDHPNHPVIEGLSNIEVAI